MVYPLAIYYSYSGKFYEKLKKALLGSIPYFSAAIAGFAAYAWFSSHAVADYEGIHFNLDIPKILITFIKQIIAAFPVVPHAYLIFDLNWNYIFDLKHAFSSIQLIDAVSAILFAYLAVKVFSSHEEIASSRKRFLIWLSILLVICPSLIISVSMKYQEGLIWGLGYLTIYITRFGLLLLGYFLYEAVIIRIKNISFKRFIQTIAVVLLVIIHLFCQQGNRNVLFYKNQSQAVREVAENSVQAGLLRGIPDNSIVLLGNIWYDYPSFTRNSVFSSFCKAKVSTDTIDNFIRESFKHHGENKTYDYTNEQAFYFHFEKFQSNEGNHFRAAENSQ